MGFVVAGTSVIRASGLEGDLRVDLSSNFLQRVQRFPFWRQLCCRSGRVWQSHLMDGVCGSGVINDGGCQIVSHTQRDGERDVVVLVLRDAGVRDDSCCFSPRRHDSTDGVGTRTIVHIPTYLFYPKFLLDFSGLPARPRS